MSGKMRYKSFVWRHNPSVFRAEYKRTTAVMKYPAGKFGVQDLGLEQEEFSGSGEFFGENAYADFRQLLKVFYLDGAGELYHPAWGSFRAVFTQLQLLQQPQEHYVAYAFRFRCLPSADAKNTRRSMEQEVDVGSEQTLDEICAAYGISAEEILQANPQLRCPAAVCGGMRVRIHAM